MEDDSQAARTVPGRCVSARSLSCVYHICALINLSSVCLIPVGILCCGISLSLSPLVSLSFPLFPQSVMLNALKHDDVQSSEAQI